MKTCSKCKQRKPDVIKVLTVQLCKSCRLPNPLPSQRDIIVIGGGINPGLIAAMNKLRNGPGIVVHHAPPDAGRDDWREDR